MEIVNFVAIIDGEVAGNLTFPAEFKNIEKIIAIYTSEPKFVRTETPIPEGSTYDGNTFTPSA